MKIDIKKPRKQYRAVIYARYSPRPQECDSDKQQIEICRKECERRGWEVLKEFTDVMKSGTNNRRLGLKKAVEFARKHRAVLVVYSLDRLSRNEIDTLSIARDLAADGASLCPLDMPELDSTTPTGSLMLGVMAVVHAYYAKIRASVTKDHIYAKMDGNERVSQIVQYGWEVEEDDHKKIRPVTVEQEVIDRIVEMRDRRGLKYREIAGILNQQGYMYRKSRVVKETDEVMVEKDKWNVQRVYRVYQQAVRRKEAAKEAAMAKAKAG